jgi:hypothetical protein
MQLFWVVFSTFCGQKKVNKILEKNLSSKLKGKEIILKIWKVFHFRLN